MQCTVKRQRPLNCGRCVCRCVWLFRRMLLLLVRLRRFLGRSSFFLGRPRGRFRWRSWLRRWSSLGFCLGFRLRFWRWSGTGSRFRAWRGCRARFLGFWPRGRCGGWAWRGTRGRLGCRGLSWCLFGLGRCHRTCCRRRCRTRCCRRWACCRFPRTARWRGRPCDRLRRASCGRNWRRTRSGRWCSRPGGSRLCNLGRHDWFYCLRRWQRGRLAPGVCGDRLAGRRYWRDSPDHWPLSRGKVRCCRNARRYCLMGRGSSGWGNDRNVANVDVIDRGVIDRGVGDAHAGVDHWRRANHDLRIGAIWRRDDQSES
jgi:hypothetical protein